MGSNYTINTNLSTSNQVQRFKAIRHKLTSNKMRSNRKYTITFKEAKTLFKIKTGVEYNSNQVTQRGMRIFKLKIMKTKTRKYFVGSYMEWLNL